MIGNKEGRIEQLLLLCCPVGVVSFFVLSLSFGSVLMEPLQDAELPRQQEDLVLTEDSPGTVDALAKGSDYYKNLYIMGGVDLSFDAKSEASYVYDRQAVNAVHEAVSRLSSRTHSGASSAAAKEATGVVSEPFSFDDGSRSYTVVPQHSLTSGKDRRGNRCQTDLALKREGARGLELVRYYNPNRGAVGEFGPGWHLLIPYRITPVGTRTREFLNARIPIQMAVENLLTGGQEVLTFSAGRYSIAGYVPDKLEASQAIGLFIMTDASYRLADKLGNEFWFDQRGLLTDMIFSRDHHMRIEYQESLKREFGARPYRIEPADREQITFLNARIPRRMKVIDLLGGSSEVLVFSDKGRIAGYVPHTEDKSRFTILGILSDGSFRLFEKSGNQIAFDAGGQFDGLTFSPERPMVQAISMGDRRITFTYPFDRSGHARIASANLTEGSGRVGPTYLVKYQYDAEGRLARVLGPGSHMAVHGEQEPAETGVVG